METLAISAANLDILENNLSILNKNINSVTDDIININGKITNFNGEVDELKANVNNLEQEIRDFMKEIRSTTVVSNAQNDILIKETELNKKFGNYDTIRRKINGLIEGIELNSISKKTLINESENALLNNPNYYLSYALIAICSWFNNDKDMAYKSLIEALKLEPSKTALLLALIHLKLNRTETAKKWMRVYISSCDPRALNIDFANSIEGVTNSIYTPDMTEEIIKSISIWKETLKNYSNFEEREINRYEQFFSNNKETINENYYPYTPKYTNNWNRIKESLINANSYQKAYENFENKITNVNNTSQKTIDTILHELVFNYEPDELKLKKEVERNNLIIKNEGNINKASEEFELNKLNYDEKQDLYSIFSNIILEKKDVSLGTKKLATSYMKDIIKKSINTSLNSNTENIGTTEIRIGEWNGSTTNGENEKELKESLTNSIKIPYKNKINNESFLNIKTIGSIIGFVTGIILLFYKITIPGTIIMLAASIVALVSILQVNKQRKIIVEECNNDVNSQINLLENIIAEIVDINFEIKRSKTNLEDLINYLDSFKETNYIANRKI